MKKIAIVTGASSGLGAEFIKNIHYQYPTIDEVWTIQRREIEDGASELPIRSICLDLTDNQNYPKLEAILKEENPDIRLLINNAGFGKIGNLCDSKYDEQGLMVDLNIRAATVITTICLPYMQRGANIINIASIAAFAPNPRMTVYSSTKAYVLSFSKSLREELKPLGINCIAVCPGPMYTEFLPVAGIEKGASKTFDTLPYADPSKVAVKSLKKAKSGATVYTPLFFYKFYRVLAKLLPHNLIMKMSKT